MIHVYSENSTIKNIVTNRKKTPELLENPSSPACAFASHKLVNILCLVYSNHALSGSVSICLASIHPGANRAPQPGSCTPKPTRSTQTSQSSSVSGLHQESQQSLCPPFFCTCLSNDGRFLAPWGAVCSSLGKCEWKDLQRHWPLHLDIWLYLTSSCMLPVYSLLSLNTVTGVLLCAIHVFWKCNL
jgi:hypothetical protein